MEFLLHSLCIFLVLSLLSFTNSQQIYINETQLDCENTETSRITNGFLCNGVNVSCDSYVTFRSLSPYDSPSAIATLFALEPQEIAKINNINIFDKIASDTLITVPVSCSCSGDFYQHYTTYTVKVGDGYFSIANNTYQGLTTCQALKSRNPNSGVLLPGMTLIVPLRCACPSRNQTESGVRFLLAYLVTWRDTIYEISKHFGVEMQSIFSANVMANYDLIFPFTTILVPLRNQSCTAAPGSYLCYCNPAGYIREWREDDPRCSIGAKSSSVKSAILTGFGIGGGLLITVLATSWVYRYLKRRKKRKQKEKLFKQNGGLLLEQRISSNKSNVGKSRVFTEEELEKATNNFSEDRILGRGGSGIVFKGMLSDGSIVAIKKCKSKVVDESQVEQFINEVVILSQINHRNVVKLLGCCLESEVPILVYEYVSNGTLFDYIHKEENKASSGSFPLEERLRIAWEVAGAIAYMHSAASMPIFHRDIKSTNILLDDTYTAKVSDFGTSRSVPLDKTHLTTMVLVTFGYLDPEYFQSSQFTDKSDVYSFGVVLVELLTGETPISFTRSQEDRNLAAHFVLSVKGNSLYEILHPCVVNEAGEEEILAMANLALRCLKRSGKKRPTMREVTMELESLRRSQLSLLIK